MDRRATSERVRSFAREEGFEVFGLATLAPATTASAFRRWLARGDHATMAWMERHRALREDPRGLLPGAKSALVVALRYAPRGKGGGAEASPLWRRVARYAHGDDYHDILRRRLRRVAERIKTMCPEVGTRICVDTAPLLERELAARAGVGAIGKNTTLIHPRYGSWLLLGELLLTLDLEPDPPVSDLCGRCSRCLEACPTGALPAPYRLDARRCLSYWTIEHRGEVPPALRPHLADHLFGCDVCQEVCPRNDGAPGVDEPELEVPEIRRGLSLVALLRLDAEQYVELFRRSPMKRVKLEGLRRNAALALAGALEPGAEAALAAVAADEASPVVRSAAVWAKGRRRGASGAFD